MDGKVLAAFKSLLSNMAAGRENDWNPGLELLYDFGLEDIPNEDFGVVARAVTKSCKFRPSPAEVLDIWRKVTAPEPDVSFADALIEVRGLIRKFGANARRVPGSNIYLPGPPEFSSEMVAKTVDAMGGWEQLATDPGEARIWQAQFERVFQAITKQASEPEIAKLRLEYTERRLTLLDEQAA